MTTPSSCSRSSLLFSFAGTHLLSFLLITGLLLLLYTSSPHMRMLLCTCGFHEESRAGAREVPESRFTQERHAAIPNLYIGNPFTPLLPSPHFEIVWNSRTIFVY